MDFLLQDAVLLFSTPLLLLGNLKGLCELSVFHIELLQQQARSGTLLQLGESHVYIENLHKCHESGLPACPLHTHTPICPNCKVFRELTQTKHNGKQDVLATPII